ncbi:MAG TPA: ribokinase [Caulobacteraceae bacterium]|nr:ribokinase [Caulobacteraceae bacterium]
MSVCVLGSLNLDLVCRVAELPRPGETVMGGGVAWLPGGKGANQAVAAARCAAGTRLIGAVGWDEAGDKLLATMAEAGVDTAAVVRLEGHPTGQAFIWVSDAGENSIVVAGGANLAVSAAMLEAPLPADCRVLLAQLETPVAAIEALFAGAPAGRLRLLNAAPAVLEGRRLFPLVDILIVNETELAAFATVPVVADDVDAVAAVARGLISRPDQTVVVTLGKAGAVAVGADRRIIVSGRTAKVVDTTGAGDCFCGVLAARLDEGADLAEALQWANAAAALSTERPGAAPSMPTRAEIVRSLQA